MIRKRMRGRPTTTALVAKLFEFAPGRVLDTYQVLGLVPAASHSAVRMALKRLADEGTIQRVRLGEYRLAGSGSTRSTAFACASYALRRLDAALRP